MGVYDMIIDKEKGINIQIKSIICEMKCYNLGDDIKLPNGCHLGYEGYFIVEDGKIIYIGTEMWDKWGDNFDWVAQKLSENNPIRKIMNTIKSENKE